MDRVALAWLVGLLALAGCQPDLAECATGNDAVVYLSDGTPMYEGQALVYNGCAFGRCHNSKLSESLRNGAPHGLDFDMDLACLRDDADCDERVEESERLERVSRKVVDFDREILRTLQDGSMPPGNEVASENQAFRTFELGALSDPLPAITTREGRRIVSEWLGCGAPIVQAARRPDGTTTFPGQRCDDQVGGRDCRFAAIIPPPDPQWGGETGIYQRIVVNLGCLSCHRPGRDAFNPDEQELDLCLADVETPEVEDCNPTMVLASLVDQPAVGFSTCPDGATHGTLITNSHTTSFFYAKLTATPVCGDSMPSGTDGIADDEVLAPIRQWIMEGAMP